MIMSNYLDKDVIVELMTKEDVINILVDLGAPQPKELPDGSLLVQSICHGSNSHKLYYYHEAKGDYPAKVFHCYSRCGDTFGIFELVIRAKRAQGVNLRFYQALVYVATLCDKLDYAKDISAISNKTDMIDDWEWINKFKKNSTQEASKHTITQSKAISESVLDMFSYEPHSAFLNDNISAEVMSEFEIGYWGKTNQIIIPHRNINGELVGVRGRYLNPEDIENIGKYVPIIVQDKFLSHSLGSNLYGAWQNREAIKKFKKALVIEGEKSVLQNHTYFGSNDFSVATCGSSLTQAQISILVNYFGVEEVILGYDKEFMDADSLQAQLYINKLLKRVAPLLPYCKVSILHDDLGLLEYKDSPTDKGKDKLLELLENKKVITTDDLRLLENTTIK